MSTPHVQLVELDAVTSTQDEVQDRLDRAPAGTLVAVRARSQRVGRGRDGRRWVDPPGDAVMVSVGIDGVPTAVLLELPARIAQVLLETIAAPRVAWKQPNDLVDGRTGAKVAGILVDARTTGDRARVVVGVGINVAGAAFTLDDGRAATTLEELGARADPGALAEDVAAAIGTLLTLRN